MSTILDEYFMTCVVERKAQIKNQALFTMELVNGYNLREMLHVEKSNIHLYVVYILITSIKNQMRSTGSKSINPIPLLLETRLGNTEIRPRIERRKGR